MEERFLRLKEILCDEEVAKKLLVLSPEEVSRILQEQYQLSFSVEELNDIAKGIMDSVAEANGEELSESELAEVAGGARGSESYQFGRSVGRATPVVVALVTVAVICGW